MTLVLHAPAFARRSTIQPRSREISFTSRPARGIANHLMRELGPLSDLPPEFPLASGPLGPLQAMAEVLGRGGFLIVLGRRERCRTHG